MNLSTSNPTAPSQSTQSSQPNPQPNNNSTNRTQEKTNLIFQRQRWNDPRKVNTPDNSLSGRVLFRAAYPPSKELLIPISSDRYFNASKVSEARPNLIISHLPICPKQENSQNQEEGDFADFLLHVYDQKASCIVDVVSAQNSDPYPKRNEESPHRNGKIKWIAEASQPNFTVYIYDLSTNTPLKPVHRITRIRHTSPDGTINLTTLHDLISQLKKELRGRKDPIFFCCESGFDVSAVVAAAFMLQSAGQQAQIKSEEAVEKVIAQVRMKRGESSIQAKGQFELLVMYRKFLLFPADVAQQVIAATKSIESSIQENAINRGNVQSAVKKIVPKVTQTPTGAVTKEEQFLLDYAKQLLGLPTSGDAIPAKGILSRGLTEEEEKSPASAISNQRDIGAAWEELEASRMALVTAHKINDPYLEFNPPPSRFADTINCYRDTIVTAYTTVNGQPVYLNANCLSLELPSFLLLGLSRKLILAQAPFPISISDNQNCCLFWLALCNNDVGSIIDLTSPEERMGNYYPTVDGQPIRMQLSDNHILIVLKSSKLYEDLESCYVFTYTVTINNKTFNVERIRYENWHDTTACSAAQLKKLVEITYFSGGGNSPILIHCSGGINRASTLAAASLVLCYPSLSKSNLSEVIKKTVETIRKERNSDAINQSQFRSLCECAISFTQEKEQEKEVALQRPNTIFVNSLPSVRSQPRKYKDSLPTEDEEKSPESTQSNPNRGNENATRVAAAWACLMDATKELALEHIIDPSHVVCRFIDVPCLSTNAIGIPSTERFLHANWMQVQGRTGFTIAAQAPRTDEPANLSDFWSVVYSLSDSEQRNVTIIDLTAPGEIQPYYYPIGTEPMLCDPYSLVLEKTAPAPNFPNCSITTYQISWKGESQKRVDRIHFSDWQDGKCCTLEQLEQLVALIAARDSDHTLTHCKAGLNRTGTFIVAVALQAIKNQITRSNFVSKLIEQILEFRKVRGSTAITKLQFNLLYQYAESLCSS